MLRRLAAGALLVLAWGSALFLQWWLCRLGRAGRNLGIANRREYREDKARL